MSLYIFDKDNTLVFNSVNPNKSPNKTEEQKVLPNVLEKLAELRTQGHMIAIASNQGGVAWGFISFDQARELMQDCANKIGGAHWQFCPHDLRAAGKGVVQYAIACECRKPMPGMIEELGSRWGYLMENIIFVGDQESDRQAAENAGVKFIWAKDFFTQI